MLGKNYPACAGPAMQSLSGFLEKQSGNQWPPSELPMFHRAVILDGHAEVNHFHP